ncbi:MAG: hypothetical protein ABJE95_34920 [Byssovorax sp.]
MNARYLIASALPLLSTLVLGCSFDFNLGNPTTGVLHQASFAYVSGACLLGCPVDPPMMVGSTGTFVVAGDRLPDELRVHADPTGVLATSLARTRSCCTNESHSSSCSPIGDGDRCTATLETTFTLTVHLQKAGKAPLQVFDAQGELIDFVIIEARDPASLAVSCSPEAGGGSDAPLDTIQLGKGARCDLSVEARDAAGQALRATDDGFTLAIGDPAVSVLRPALDWFDALEDPAKSDVLAASSGTLVARAAGATVVNVTAGALTRAVPVEVK